MDARIQDWGSRLQPRGSRLGGFGSIELCREKIDEGSGDLAKSCYRDVAMGCSLNRQRFVPKLKQLILWSTK